MSATTKDKVAKTPELENDQFRIASEIGILVRPQGGCYLFNPSIFSPARTDAAIGNLREIINKIRTDGVSHLDQAAIDFLAHHGIIVPLDFNDTLEKNLTDDDWQDFFKQTPYTIRLKTDCDALNSVFPALEAILQFLSNTYNNKADMPLLQIKYFVDHPKNENWINAFNRLITFVAGYVNPDDVDYYLEGPVESMSQCLQLLRYSDKSNIQMNFILTTQSTTAALDDLSELVEMGYCPHLIFNVDNNNIEQTRTILNLLISKLGYDGFTFNFIPQLDPTLDDTSNQTEFINNLKILIDQCFYSDKFDPNQFWLYRTLRSRTSGNTPPKPFPCLACVNRTIFLNSENTFFACHKEADYESSLKVNHEELLTFSQPIFFGPSDFARDFCDHCELRYYCGGICQYVGHHLDNTKMRRQLFKIHCQMRKHVLMQLFEEAISLSSRENETVQYKFFCENNNIKIIPME